MEVIDASQKEAIIICETIYTRSLCNIFISKFQNFARNFYHWNRVYLLFTLFAWKSIKLVFKVVSIYEFDRFRFIRRLPLARAKSWKTEILTLKFNRNRCKLIRFLFHGIVQFLRHRFFSRIFHAFVFNLYFNLFSILSEIIKYSSFFLFFFFLFNPFQRSCNALFTNFSIQRK